MASDHSTGNGRPVNLPAERRLTVGRLHYEYPPKQNGSVRDARHVPWLQMRGDWLSAAGFDIRAPVRVRVMRGCLVLTVEKIRNKTPRSITDGAMEGQPMMGAQKDTDSSESETHFPDHDSPLS